MDVAPIKTRRDYRAVLKHIEGLMAAKRGTPEGDPRGSFIVFAHPRLIFRPDQNELPLTGFRKLGTPGRSS